MKITKKQIKEQTITTELPNNGKFERYFKHYFEVKFNNEKFHKIKFSLIGNEMYVTTYWNRLNDPPKEELIHIYSGKRGFIDGVYEYLKFPITNKT